MDQGRLSNIALFAGFPEDALEEIARQAGEASYDDGAKIVSQDSPSDRLFVIEQGTAEVRKGDDVLAQLGEGDVVGEMGIVDRSLRNADVIAQGSVSAIFLTQDQIRRIERDFPGFKARLEATESERGG